MLASLVGDELAARRRETVIAPICITDTASSRSRMTAWVVVLESKRGGVGAMSHPLCYEVIRRQELHAEG